MVWYGIVGFNVQLDTLQVISETILRVRWPNQQCHNLFKKQICKKQIQFYKTS